MIPEVEFIALLTAVRVVHADSERTNFGRVAHVLWRHGDAEIRDLVAQFRKHWRATTKIPLVFNMHGEHLNPERILDTWMNGEVFHQDADLGKRVDLLHGMGPMAYMVLQQTVRDYCFPLLGLDNVCAMALSEPSRPLPTVDPTMLVPSERPDTG